MKKFLCLFLVLISLLTLAVVGTSAASNNNLYLGDANLDGKITIRDATIIQKVIANIYTLGQNATKAADVDESNDLNIKDATAIQKWLASIDLNYPIGNQILSIGVNVNEFYNEYNDYYTPNSLTIRPKHIYWENGYLIAECYVINGFAHSVYNIYVNNLQFSNEKGVIAESPFGTLNNLILPAYSSVEWTFKFHLNDVYNTNATLNTVINYMSDCDYYY